MNDEVKKAGENEKSGRGGGREVKNKEKDRKKEKEGFILFHQRTFRRINV